MQHESRRIQVVLARDEFVTLQREVVTLGKSGADVELLNDASELIEYFKASSSKSNVEQDVTVVFVSLVNSCTQNINDLAWALDLPQNVILIIDVTQAICNLPLELHFVDQLVQKDNVFLVGSLIKHARCGEGVGFLVCAANASLSSGPSSGWTAFVSGLANNQTADLDEKKLYYDRPLEWDGGTPSCLESAFVAVEVLRSMPPVPKQHEYVQSIKAIFLEKSRHLFSASQLANISTSNTLAIPIVNKMVGRPPFGLDTKTVNGKTFLRIGFGIHNLECHLVALVQELESFLCP